MHELPVTERILSIVLKHAIANNVKKVVSITLHVGDLSELENEWIQHYFDYLSKDTPAAGAELKIERIPIVLECGRCKQTFAISKSELADIACPHCEATDNFSMISGKEYYIKEMEAI